MADRALILCGAMLLLACAPRHVVTEAAAEAARHACTYGAGAMAQQTLATDDPTGAGIPIDHILWIMQENHSFDSIFSQLGGGALGAPSGATNPNADGAPVERFHQPEPCVSEVNHSWAGSHEEYDDGKNDQFVNANNPGGARAMGYWDESDLPFYYALARTFAISDSHFCSMLGPTTPNRLFSWAGTSFGTTANDIAPATDPAGNPYPNIFTELDAAKVSWKYYTDSSPPEGAALVQTFLQDSANYLPVSAFMADAAAGTLPSFAIVEPHTTSYADDQDEHPPGNIQLGQAFTASVVQALMASPDWARSALFFSYDEHGGFYDSVPPVPACPPDQLAPKLQPGDPAGAFNLTGFRVPLIVVSPYAKRGYVSHAATEHTSLLRFVEARFGLPAMTARDANADPLYDLFDFGHPDTSVPALPAATIDAAGEAWCNAMFPDPSP